MRKPCTEPRGGMREIAADQDDLAILGRHGELAVENEEVLVMCVMDVRPRAEGARRDDELLQAEKLTGRGAGQFEQMLDAGCGDAFAVASSHHTGGHAFGRDHLGDSTSGHRCSQ